MSGGDLACAQEPELPSQSQAYAARVHILVLKGTLAIVLLASGLKLV
ncbi:MAG: hypothetical protein V3U26_00095 [Dehalococcoidia bacterium]